MLPPAEELFAQRSRRAKKGTHPVDENVSLELVTAQIEVFRQCAIHLAQNGIRVYIREGTEKNPVCIVDLGDPGE
jgi:hypothetical protein